MGPGIDVYEGMVVGRSNSEHDVTINVVKAKKMTNMRAAGSDENVRLAPPEELSLERAIEFIEDDELVEATPEGDPPAQAHPRRDRAPRLRKREVAAQV